jgi:hypothetical protein
LVTYTFAIEIFVLDSIEEALRCRSYYEVIDSTEYRRERVLAPEFSGISHPDHILSFGFFEHELVELLIP